MPGFDTITFTFSEFKLWEEKFAWCVKAKHCWALSTNVWKQKVCWHHPAMFCLITSSKLSCQWFEFSLKVKAMGWNPGYLLKSFLLERFDHLMNSPKIEYKSLFLARFVSCHITTEAQCPKMRQSKMDLILLFVYTYYLFAQLIFCISYSSFPALER